MFLASSQDKRVVRLSSPLLETRQYTPRRQRFIISFISQPQVVTIAPAVSME
jgi:hypothetical protein